MAEREPQVVVAGAGPAGLVAGITLARYGVRVLVVEKRASVSSLSRALVISTRSTEILRSWGLEAQVRAGAADVEPCGWVTPTLASGDGTVLPLGHPTKAEAASVSPTGPVWAPQDHLEPILLATLRGTGLAEVRFGCELSGLAQDDDGVTAVLRCSSTGQDATVRARYLIGADGAHSTVRGQLGIGMEGPDALAEYHRVEFRAPLAEIAGDRRYGLTVITHPEAAGVLAPRGAGDRWELSREWRPGQPRFDDMSADQLAGLIATAAGVSGLRPKIERVSCFSFAAQIADRYRERRGFLAGEAAHRMTPRGRDRDEHGHPGRLRSGLETRMGAGRMGTARPAGLLPVRAPPRRVAQRHPLREARRRPQPGGGRRRWDLNGRVAHQWLKRGSDLVSTLDLLGDAFTLLAGPAEPGWEQVAAGLNTRAPVAVHTVDEPTAHGIGIEPGGALLVRPDGRPVLRWLGPAAPVGDLPAHFRR